ncbi:C45 family autoproteolytic acyltransferase/hydolase [Nakamurella sp.]|uniref:C45 family autoproteolytic acyltransferase/hydolase n=1 Tax=Nakamurella sp. TaxID=1869182 RepID=UPI003783E75A
MTHPDSLTFHHINEPVPGERWQLLFQALWPGYRSWYLQDGDAARPDLTRAADALRRFMPELVPTWRRLVELADGDPTAARMLTLFDPPRFLPGCAQLAVRHPEPTLVRNYDYHPDLLERVIYSSRFADRWVIGTGDCLWGLLDGMNDDGLAVSLTFAGERGSGPGFGIPLVVRYLLETAATIADGVDVLRRVPVHMAYNLMLLDRRGRSCTVLVRPGRPAEVFDLPAVTNHRGTTPLDPAHAARFRSVERQRALFDLLDAGAHRGDVVDAFLRPPLYNTEFERGFGTLYTAAYRPAAGTVDYAWPGSRWQLGFDSPPGIHDARYRGAVDALA